MPFVILILLVFGFVFFIVAAWPPTPPETPRWKFVCYGLAAWILAEILTRGSGLPLLH